MQRILAAALTGALGIALTPGAFAQVTAEQQAAIKSSCRSDYMSNCMSVKPGGPEALQCLQRNMAKLSPSCQSAVNATMPKPAPAVATPAAPPPAAPPPAPAAAAAPAAPAPAIVAAKPPAASIAVPKPAKTVTSAAAAAPAAPQVTAAQQSAIKSACRSDFMAKCSGVQPGGAQALQCLQKNAARLSPGCQAAVGATMPKQAAVPPAATAVAAPAAADAPPMPTAMQMSAVKNTCRADFRRNCKGVEPGGPEALACLQRNAARLSPNCKTSLADIADSMPAEGAAVPAAAATTTTTTTTEHRRLPPGITPAGRILRRVMERNQQ
ncbi:MAG: hypothetical protein JSR61_06085 [Proteobacteria bacterium]|nr:hypothetical protein [Pseudomonadota bacterium]